VLGAFLLLRTRQEGEIMKKLFITLAILCLAGNASAEHADGIGMYFDEEALDNCMFMPGGLVTGHLIITNPSNDTGISGWECYVENTPGLLVLEWTLEGTSPINFSTPPEFTVTLAVPLPPNQAVVVARATIFVADPACYWLQVRQSNDPLIIGSPAYVGGPPENMILPLFPTAGDNPNAGLNCLDCAPTLGTVVIDPDPDILNAPWSLEGPGGPWSGNGDAILSGMITGDYTLAWGEVGSWETPVPNPVLQTLPLDDTITFSGVYSVAIEQVVTNTLDSGPGSLRQAINNANTELDQTTILFNIPLAELGPISPLTPLPAITAPIVIDGYSQEGASKNTNGAWMGSNAVLMVELDGLNAGGAANGLHITAPSTVRGLVIDDFQQAGILLGLNSYPTPHGSSIEGNFIGTDAAGTGQRGNQIGVLVLNGSNNTIGGLSAAARNVISGNDSTAIFISGNSNAVQGNFIGTDLTGASALGNAEGGIYVTGMYNIIGGTETAARNVIAANGIGSTGHRYGIEIVSPGANNTVQGNYIGTDVTGMVGMGNSSGIALDGSAGNTIGGTEPGAGNVISAQRVGLGIWWSGSSGNLVQGNYIGTDATGSGALGNIEDGIRVWGALNNTIGGTETGAGNVVAFTENGSGISIIDPGSSGNAILSNSIFSNDRIGIDLGTWDGVTMNDATDLDTGPNGFQNFPVLLAAGVAVTTQIDGTLNSTPDMQFRIEFFSNTASDPTGYGEGETFIGSTSVTTDAMGDIDFVVSLPIAVPPGSFISATATNTVNNTSEFSEAIEVSDGCPSGNLVFVDSDAMGTGDGESWPNAFPDLQEALAIAESCPAVSEIWVAEGRYMPTGDTDRAATFQLRDNLAVYGGFAGGETTLGERDWSTNVTILSGNIGVSSDLSDNSFHVVTASGTDSSAVLDGFTIVHGRADGDDDDSRGGGVINVNGSPTMANVTVVSNFASHLGGGMYSSPGSPSITNAIFSDNTATGEGGGMWISSGSPTVVDVVFSANSSHFGGGLASGMATTQIVNCTFSGNSAYRGGGMYTWIDLHGKATLINTVIWGNTGSIEDELLNINSTPTISYSLIGGCGGSGAGWDPLFGADGGNNIDDDPLFVDTGGGNFRLAPGSPAIDAGNNAAPGLPAMDLVGTPRILAGTVDMGPYESPLGGYAEVGDWVWWDDNANGIQDPEEHGSGHGYVHLYDSEGNSIAWTYSDVGPGHYSFGGLLPGDYYLTFQGLSDDSISPYDVGDDQYDSDMNWELGRTAIFTLTAGQIDHSWDCGFYFDGGAVEDGEIPNSYALHSSIPNPFNPLTTIRFDLPQAGRARLTVFDISGRKVRTLLAGESFSPGRHEAVWRGKDDSGRSVAAGVYFYRLESGSFSQTKRMTLVK
jgi:hypothetical protein